MFRGVLTAIAVSTVMIGVVFAGPLEDGDTAYQRGDYATALQLWRPLAEQGNADAQLNLGVMYAKRHRVCRRTMPRRSSGTASPPSRAMPAPSSTSASCTITARACRRTTPRRSSGTGSPPSRATPIAQFSLGVMYDNGEGVPQDNAEAVKWYRLAAEQGDADAQFNLGRMYDNGEGVPQDYAEAVKWYRLAAEQGDADAQFNLGLMYEKARVVPQDYAEAVKWYRLAAEQGDAAPSSTSASCTPTAKACRRTSSLATCGSTSRQLRALASAQRPRPCRHSC